MNLAATTLIQQIGYVGSSHTAPGQDLNSSSRDLLQLAKDFRAFESRLFAAAGENSLKAAVDELLESLWKIGGHIESFVKDQRCFRENGSQLSAAILIDSSVGHEEANRNTVEAVKLCSSVKL